MSVLIRDMEMPQKCGQCKLFHAEQPMYCMAVEGHRTVGAPYGMPRPDWCPLDEIPSHGALVDVDAMLADLTKYMRMLDPESKEYSKILWIETYLNLAKNEAIIEAED